MKTIIALYKNFKTAQQIVQQLMLYGIDHDNITLIAKKEVEEPEEGAESESITVPEGAGIGALGGGTLGLLAGMASIAIPTVGAVLAIGPLVGAVTGAGVGLVTGGIAAGITEEEISQEDADYYIEGLGRGEGFVAVRASDDRADHLAALMRRYSPIRLTIRPSLTNRSMAPEVVQTRLTQAIVQEAQKEKAAD